jgi:hypothetical protein
MSKAREEVKAQTRQRYAAAQERAAALAEQLLGLWALKG